MKSWRSPAPMLHSMQPLLMRGSYCVTTSKIPGLRIGANADQTAADCAAFIEEGLSKALKANSKATLAISGGHTPTPMFKLLAKTKLDWSRIHLFWVDERCVPPTHDQS